MKNLLLFLVTFLLINNVSGQTNFKWEKSDSIPKTKSQIYTDTKLFIAQTWQSSKEVIQNDDKDGGVILIKGISVKNASGLMYSSFEYIFEYTLTFKMKDGKYKIILDNVYCKSAYAGSDHRSIRQLEPSNEIPYPNKTGELSNKKAVEIMTLLNHELQSIVDAYVAYLKNNKSSGSAKDNW